MKFLSVIYKKHFFIRFPLGKYSGTGLHATVVPFFQISKLNHIKPMATKLQDTLAYKFTFAKTMLEIPPFL